MSIQIQACPCGMIQANAYIVQAQGREDCVVIDPGDDYEKLRRALGDRRLGAILLTHGHFDHILGAGALAKATGAPVYVGAEDVEMLNDAALNGYADLMGVRDMPGPALSARPFGAALSVCGLDFDILPTPGHSKGSVCLYLEDEGLLFSGDTLFRAGYGRYDLPGGNVQELVKSLNMLLTLPGDTKVYPGHGDMTTIEEECRRYGR